MNTAIGSANDLGEMLIGSVRFWFVVGLAGLLAVLAYLPGGKS